MRWKLSLSAALALLVAIVFAQNSEVVEVRFLFWKLAMSRALMLVSVLGIGVVLGWLLATLGRFSKER